MSRPSKQATLFAECATGTDRTSLDAVRFHGSDYDPQRDERRLTEQRQAVYDVMSDGRWWTSEAVVDAVRRNHPGKTWKSTSLDRQIRYLRDVPGCEVDKREVANRLFEFRLVEQHEPD